MRSVCCSVCWRVDGGDGFCLLVVVLEILEMPEVMRCNMLSCVGCFAISIEFSRYCKVRICSRLVFKERYRMPMPCRITVYPLSRTHVFGMSNAGTVFCLLDFPFGYEN